MTDDDMTDETGMEAEPKSSQAWLARIKSAERAFDSYQSKCDRIDRLYAKLEHLSDIARDREFQLFWSNIQVMGPAVYARPPKPVVTPKFTDRRPLYRVSSEFLERCASVAFDLSDINSVMLLVRDDLTITGRGAPWVRYETKAEADGPTERVCIEHADRRDFLHDPARKWSEVDWVAKRAWMTKREMRKRFRKSSGDAYQNADYSVQKDDRDRGAASDAAKAGVWEVWCKSENRVIWVAPGCEEILDEGEPHLKVSGFFPCPQPAYATVQRRSLVPVPDVLFYQDQLDEISDLTARIHALGRALQVKGFYVGGGEVGAAVEAAMAIEDPGKIMVPVSSMAAFGGQAGEPIVWLPIDVIAQTILSCVELRRQLIEDVYQIVGLSDIMRGATDAQETLGAQQLKQQNGSSRVRDKQNEMIRVARDLVRISAEIIVSEFDRKTMIDMAQMDIPTDADQKRQVEDLKARAKQAFDQQVAQAVQSPEAAQMPPEAQQQAMQQLQQQIMAEIGPQIEQIDKTPTIDEVMSFLKDNRLRPFVLDIETDSTIYPDEMAEKASRAEFLNAFATAVAASQSLLMAGEAGAKLAGGMIKFALGPYRVGRELEGMIDDFMDAAPQIAAAQAEGDDQGLAEANMKLAEAETMKAQAAAAKVQADAQGKMQEMQLKLAEAQAKVQDDQRKGALEVEKVRAQVQETEARIAKVFAEIEKIQAGTQIDTGKLGLDAQRLQLDAAKAAGDMESRRMEQDRAEREGARNAVMQERQQEFTERTSAEERAFKTQKQKSNKGA